MCTHTKSVLSHKRMLGMFYSLFPKTLLEINVLNEDVDKEITCVVLKLMEWSISQCPNNNS